MRKGWLLEEALEYRRRHQGVIGVESKILVRDRSVLSLVYTPGVAVPCLEIAKDPDLSYVYTCRGNTVGIVTDGSAVYQQGTVGPEAALPVMEGKAILFKTFAGVNGVPVCLKDQDLEGMVKTISLLYLPPGIARPVQEIMIDPEKIFDLTVKGNLVAVVSDGTAVLGLGDIGPLGAMPVMEGKAVLFKTFGGVEAFPICIGTKDPDEIVEVVKAISPVFGGINLEDISAPRCFRIEERLKRELEIPIFHDDQHGTAVVTLAALTNALKVTSRRFEDTKVVINGAGASGIAVAKILLSMGVKDLILCDTKGVIYQGRQEGMNPAKEEMAKSTNPRMVKGSLAEALKGANVFIGLSVAGAVTEEMVRSMAKDPIIFAMANPIPEIYPGEAKDGGAAIVATGRSDFPNQINNSLGFPGIFRGALDVRAREINQQMKVAAGLAIASLVSDRELSPGYIIPEMMDFRVPIAVAVAVAKAALETGVARRPLTPEQVEARARRIIYEGLPC